MMKRYSTSNLADFALRPGGFLAMIRRGWSYKEDRRLSELAGSRKPLEQIAKAMDRTPDGKRSIRLGLSIKSKAAKRNIGT
jgi:hypothetical protein